MLKDKVIINTRPVDKVDLIGNALEKLGAINLSMPLIRIVPITLSSRKLLDIRNGEIYKWLVFTSRNGVEILFQQLKQQGEIKSLPFKTAVFGDRTARALEQEGFAPDLVSKRNSAEMLPEELMPLLREGERVLLVLGNLAPDILQKTLESKAEVERADVYRTVFTQSNYPQILKLVKTNRYDMIIFTSPSGVKSFLFNAGSMINREALRTACLGPATERALKAEGIKPLVVASPPGVASLVKGIENYFMDHSTEKMNQNKNSI